MIIVSQDKTKIVNFDNLTQIYITRDEEETASFIRYETVDSLYDDLGEYKAEERAKEVLQEILKYYDSLKTTTIYAISDKDYPMDMKSYYEMPKE